MSSSSFLLYHFFFFFQAEDGIRDIGVTGVQTCALPISPCSPSVGLADGHLHHLVPAAVDEGLGGRHALRWPFDADLAVAALHWTTVDVPLLHWQLKFLHPSTPFPGLRSKELWYSSVLKSSSSKECSSFSSCASRTSPTPVAIIHSITEEAHYRKLVFLRPHTYTVPERMQACLFTGLPS